MYWGNDGMSLDRMGKKPCFDLKYILSFFFYFSCMYIYPYVYMCTMCLPDAHGGQERMLDPLDLSEPLHSDAETQS